MRRALSAALLGLALAGCPAEPPGGGPASPTPASPAPAAWTRLSELTPAQQAQRERAQAAAQQLGKTLKQALKAALQEGGPPGAVTVCSEQAPAIAAQVSAQPGIRIGRTSFKLRNPANTPPAWAEPLVAERVEQPSFLVGPQGQLGALLPIRAEATCLFCHGDPQTFPAELKQVLAERYPRDQATGFAAGDLRGWFWVEVAAE